MSQTAIKNKYNGSYVLLCISCPACGKGNASRWYHAAPGCYKYTEINEYGFVKCQYAHGAPFFNWKWDCGRHNGVYQKADQEYLASALMHLVDQMKGNNFAWYSKLVQNVNEQFREKQAILHLQQNCKVQ